MTLQQIISGIEKIIDGRKWSTQEVIDEFSVGYIANGVHRSVYSIKNTSMYVLKIEHQNGHFDKEPNFRNVMEFMNFCYFRYSCYEKWLAPVKLVSQDSRISVQCRVKPVARSEMPKRIPPFFTDLKISNWVRIGDRVVCCDYSYILPDQRKMKTVKWKNY